MKISRSGSAVWSGGLKDGKGAVSTQSGVLDAHPYGFATRFEGVPGTNPEELIAAAHASCFAMALSLMLGEAGLTATRIETNAVVTLEQKDGGFAITSSRLTLRATIPDADDATFRELADKAKVNCPISKLLNTQISLEAELLG